MSKITPFNHPDYNNLPPQFPPNCASAWGEDQYGIWFDLTIKHIVQRFRWIPKGQFTMGSPEEELERISSEETLHKVTLSQGYWLADTACTQALWQAVMGENPSYFIDDLQKPVEQVTWLDTQRFLSTLNQIMPALQAQLPSDAQWEYACRAGTITPFYFGETMSAEQVNYNGHYPYANGEKSQYRETPIPVTGLAINAWGLYQMHGNVWEWCFDEFCEDLGSEPVTDPVTACFKAGIQAAQVSSQTKMDTAPVIYTRISHTHFKSEALENAEDTSVQRVLRGGSWDDYGGSCRSALRLRYDADNRDFSVGFRLSLGL